VRASLACKIKRVTYHLVDDVDGVAEVRGLEPRGRERGEQLREAEARVVEVGAGDPREALVVEALRRFQQDGAHVFQGVRHGPGRDTASFSRRGTHRPLHKQASSTNTPGWTWQFHAGVVPLYSSGVVL